MKLKIFLSIFLLISSLGFGQEKQMGEIGSFSSFNIVNKYPSNLLFWKIYDNESGLDADISLGSKTATFAASRDATHPATFIDSVGVVQVTTTSNVGRFNSGYYNATGFHKFEKTGILIEVASTNYLKQSIFSAGATIGTNWNDSHTTATQVTYSLVDVKSTFNVGATVQSQRVVYTGVGADVTAFSHLFSDATAAASFAQGDIVIISAWIKGSTDSQFRLRYNEYDNVDTIGTSHVGSDIAGSISSTEWRRFTFSAVTVDADIDHVKAFVDIFNIDDGEEIDLQFANIQIEKLPFASSFIPTTTAALTRNKETLKYETSGNRSAAVESCVAKVAPGYVNNLTPNHFIADTDTKRRTFWQVGTTNDFRVDVNASDSAASQVNDIINDSWTANTEMTLGYNIQHSSPYIAGFFQGVADGTNETADDFTDPAWGTFFTVGSSGTSSQFDGTIFSIAFFDRVLTAAEMQYLHDLNWR